MASIILNKYLILCTWAFIIFTSCSLTQITEGKVKRNEERINEVSQIILEKGIIEFNVRKAEKGSLKKKLRRLNVWNVKVHFDENLYGIDSVIVMSKMSGILRMENIIVDFSKQDRDLSVVGRKQIHNKIYYRTYVAMM